MSVEDSFDELRKKLRVKDGTVCSHIMLILESGLVDLERIANALEDMRDAGPDKKND